MGRTSAVGPLPALLPRPRRARRDPGQLRLRDDLPIVLPAGSDDGDFASACRLRERVREATGVRLVVETHARSDDLGMRIELGRRGEAGQGYELRVRPDGVRVEAEGRPGLQYGVETLAQLAGRGSLPACRIEDAPDFERRGILLDVSRGKVPTPESLRELVELCARFKLNVLMLYVEHTFRFRRHPEIGAGASPLDAETLRALDAYAAARHVELIPCLQSLGHMEHVLRIPRYTHLAETERLWTLAPEEPGSYALLRELYEEFLPNFRSPLFNANCDEPYDLGRGRSATRAAELGPGGLYLEHVRRVRELARALGKRTMIWGDVVHAHPERIAEIPDDLVLLDWAYEAEDDVERARVFAEHGLEFWVCPGTSSWNALFPRVENARRNIERWAAAGRRHGARGLLLTDWGDFGHYNLQGNSWYAYAFAAQQAWSGAARDADLERAFAREWFGDASGAAARLYRELGRWHDVGLPVANGSALQLLYFEDVDACPFSRGVRPAALERTRRGLERARARIAAAADRFRRERDTLRELELAADASLLAVRKAKAAQSYAAWREGRSPLGARARARLARELRLLAHAQAELGRRLRRLWMRRSQPGGFEATARRLRRSLRGLRRAAARLESGQPPPALAPHAGTAPATVLAELRRGTGLDPGA